LLSIRVISLLSFLSSDSTKSFKTVNETSSHTPYELSNIFFFSFSARVSMSDFVTMWLKTCGILFFVIANIFVNLLSGRD